METEQHARKGPQRKAPEGFYTRAEAAAKVGRSAVTLKRWHNTGRFIATHWRDTGDTGMWLYSDDDIEAMKKIAAEMPVGRPKKAHHEVVS